MIIIKTSAELSSIGKETQTGNRHSGSVLVPFQRDGRGQLEDWQRGRWGAEQAEGTAAPLGIGH